MLCIFQLELEPTPTFSTERHAVINGDKRERKKTRVAITATTTIIIKTNYQTKPKHTHAHINIYTIPSSSQPYNSCST